VRANGDKHFFSVLVATDRKTLTSISLPPECPHHQNSKVVRDGLYGLPGAKRQRYRCYPEDPAQEHSFVPPLSRKAVQVGVEDCPTCDELLSPHRGTLTAARHTPWDLATYALALNDLSQGQSYARTSLAMRERRGEVFEHLTADHGFAPADLPAAGRSGSVVAQEGAKAWHLAADLVEQYAPLLLETRLAPVRHREETQRRANDELRERDPGAALAAPLVFVLDELPVKVRRDRSQRHDQWYILAAIELRWTPGPTPMDYPRHENRIRLLRAYPTADATAWRLVLGELDVRPDFIVADCGSAITSAINSHYGPGVVPHIPSLFHIHRNIRDGIKDLPGTTRQVQGREALVPELAKHLDLLTRDELLTRTVEDWSAWWDDLIAAVAAVPAPLERLLNQRPIYEPKLAAALPLLRTHPHLPASNAAIENRFRATLDPFLTNRKQLYRNLARLNFLLDLATARDQGAFRDLDKVAKLIRDGNEAASGWAPTPRALTDTQPPATPTAAGGRRAPYSSLYNPLLVPALAKSRNPPAPAAPALADAQQHGATP
jgi:hypothetical protein